jgi:hypothetical protein
MSATTRPTPDTVLAHVRLLRLTDQLLEVADEVRAARDELRSTLEPTGASVAPAPRGGNRNAG